MGFEYQRHEERGIETGRCMSKTTYNIPEELLVRLKNLLAAVGHHGASLTAGEPPYEIGTAEIKEAQVLYEILKSKSGTKSAADRVARAICIACGEDRI